MLNRKTILIHHFAYSFHQPIIRGQGCLGHSSATTALNIYAHSFQAAQVRAMDSVADCILKRDTKSSA